MRGLAIALFFSFTLSATAFANDLDDGEKAVNSGEYPQALKLLTPLAESGNPKAQRLLGIIYDNGAGQVRADFSKATYWWTKASDNGDELGTFYLALRYMNSVMPMPTEPTIDDCKAALSFLNTHKEVAYGSVYKTLGQLYEYGRCVERDGIEAIRNYRLALTSKRPSISDDSAVAKMSRQFKPQEISAINLSLMYMDGTIVLQNYKLAHAWANIAVTFGSEPNLRDRIAEKMTATQIAEAQSIAERCVKSKYIDCE